MFNDAKVRNILQISIGNRRKVRRRQGYIHADNGLGFWLKDRGRGNQ